MIIKIAIGIIFTFFYSFVNVATCSDIKHLPQIQCGSHIVTIINNLEYSKKLTGEQINLTKKHQHDVVVSIWNDKHPYAAYSVHIRKGQSCSFRVCPNQKITTFLVLVEFSLLGTLFVQEAHCGIFTAQTNGKNSSVIKITGKYEPGAGGFTYLSKISYLTSNINNLGVFKSKKVPAVCTPNHHPSATESGDDPN